MRYNIDRAAGISGTHAESGVAQPACPNVGPTKETTMDEATARSLFRGKNKLNCAQAVLKAFQPAFGTSDREIQAFKTAGDGRAPEGLCGALHAARHLLQDPSLARELEALFERKGGSTRCKEIRKAKKLPCGDCVALAANFLQDHMPQAGESDAEGGS
jgi:hypothetical protein